VLKWL